MTPPSLSPAGVPSIRAYAKINLGLLVLEKRPDGYHNIETVFHRVNLYDEITLKPSPELVVESSSKEAPSDERNICFKAAKLVQEHLGIKEGVRISIQKTIPVGAGLGGGSSDAAIVLLHLPLYWGKTVSEETLMTMAMQLGSDVPFFLKKGSAFAKGRGEMLDYFHLDVPYSILLCHPGLRVSTAWAYQHVKPKHRSVDLRTLVECGMKDSQQLFRLTNDFETAVFKSHPVVGRIKEVMLESGAAFSSMSGSGSTVYGLFTEWETARKASSHLSEMGFGTSLTPSHFKPAEM